MLPVILIGEETERLQQINRCIVQQCRTPCRTMVISAQALELPHLMIPSIILFDVNKQCSFDLGSYICQVKLSLPDTGVLVSLPFGHDALETSVIAAGADDILARPISAKRMELTLRNLSELVTMRTLNNVAISDMNPTAAVHANSILPLVDMEGQLRRLHHVEQDVIQYALSYCNGRISKASRALGIGRSTFYRKLEMIKPRASNDEQRHVGSVA